MQLACLPTEKPDGRNELGFLCKKQTFFTSFRRFQNLWVAKRKQIDYNAPVLERHTPTKEEKTMCFNFCNIWQLLCQLGGFGC